MDSKGQALSSLIGLAIAIVVGFIVITELISNYATLKNNALVQLSLTVFIPVGLMLGIGRVLGFI